MRRAARGRAAAARIYALVERQVSAPRGTVSAGFRHPQQGALLWVYEGMTQYLGDVLAARAGFETPAQYRDLLAQNCGDAGLHSGARLAID